MNKNDSEKQKEEESQEPSKETELLKQADLLEEKSKKELYKWAFEVAHNTLPNHLESYELKANRILSGFLEGQEDFEKRLLKGYSYIKEQMNKK
jgi:hypothetical protein